MYLWRQGLGQEEFVQVSECAIFAPTSCRPPLLPLADPSRTTKASKASVAFGISQPMRRNVAMMADAGPVTRDHSDSLASISLVAAPEKAFSNMVIVNQDSQMAVAQKRRGCR